MSILAQTTINLELAVSQAFANAVDEELDVYHGDMSELGLSRRRLRAELHLPLLDSVNLMFPASAKSKFWRNFVDIPAQAAEGSSVRIKARTDGLKDVRIAEDEASTANAIRKLQKALDPEELVSHESIMASKRVQDFMTLQQVKAKEAYAVFAAYLTSQMDLNEKLTAFLIAKGILEVEARTASATQVIKDDDVRGMSSADQLTVLSLLGTLPDPVQKAMSTIDLVEAVARMPMDESLGSHPLLAPSYATARAELMSQAFEPPEKIKAIFEKKSHAGAVTGIIEYGAGNDWVAVNLKPGKEAIFGEFLTYCISLRQILPSAPERAREFAMARVLVVRHGLFLDSKEVSVMKVTDTLSIDINELLEFHNLARSPERFYACLYASVISFMKSGHHASAANLDNTLMRLLGALGYNVPIDVCRSMIPTAVYNGPHVASMRMLYGFLLYKNRTDKVTNAVAYRLHPNPPGAAAYCNLELFIDSLYYARFFDVLDRTAEYNAFKMAMKEIRRTMYYVAPYSLYLFNRSVPDPTALKAEAAKLAAYASALTAALPSTTLTMSPALYKLAQNEGRNSISASLYVTAYAAGFTRFFRHTIESAIAKKFGVSRQQIAL